MKLALPALLTVLPIHSLARPIPVPNPGFEQGGKGLPDGWRQTDGIEVIRDTRTVAPLAPPPVPATLSARAGVGARRREKQ
jgi:hypothetical protein